MTEFEILDIMEFLRGCYPQVKFTDANIDAYTLMLQDLPYEPTKRAVVKLVATSKYPPTIAEIRREVANQVHEPIPDVDEAYEEAREFAKHRYNPNVGPLSAAELEKAGLRPLTAKALASVGVDVMATTTEPSVVAAQFKAAYQRLVESVQERRVLPPAALPTPRTNGHLPGVRADRLVAARLEIEGEADN